MYASTLPRSNWLRRASIRLAWYRHMPASSYEFVVQLIVDLWDSCTINPQCTTNRNSRVWVIFIQFPEQLAVTQQLWQKHTWQRTVYLVPDKRRWRSLRLRNSTGHASHTDWYNKCIGGDTKAAARQSSNCIKKTKWNKIKYGEKRFSIWRMEFLHLAMWHLHGSGIVTVNSPTGLPSNVTRGSGMTCHYISPNVRHTGILLLVSISAISPQSTKPSLQNFIQIGPPSAEKNDVMSIFKMAYLRHLRF